MKITEFSEPGLYHAENSGKNQDALCYAQNKDFCVITVSDGVSACAEAGRGAEIAGRALTELLLKKGRYFLSFDRARTAELALSHVLYALRRQAEHDGRAPEDYSSTLSSVLVDKRRKLLLCFNLGDGLILAAGDGKCRTLSLPDSSTGGCCVTTTENAVSRVSVGLFDAGGLDSVVICSDGAWKQMYAQNRLKPEVFSLLTEGKYAGLKEYLTKQNCFDDHSFISLDLQQKNRRRSA